MRDSWGMAWHLATWLDKHQSPDGEHKITVVRDLDDAEVEAIRDAIHVAHTYVTRETFVLVIHNHAEYQAFEEHVRTRAREDPTPQLQDDAAELGSGLRFRFLNWLLSFKTFLDLTEADLTRRFGGDSQQLAEFHQATSNEYDANFSYRFIYKLRNFGQHSTFPPLEGGIVVEVDDDGGSQRTVELFLNKQKLLQSDRWTTVRPELEALPDEIPVAEHMNAGMDSLANIAAAVKRIDHPALIEAAHLFDQLWAESDLSSGVPLIGEFDESELEGDEGGMRWQWIPKLRIRDPTNDI